jgi:DNA-binding NtrC family response regulator
VTSKRQVGTTFKMCYPAIDEQPVEATDPASSDWIHSDETVLLCEDESVVRRLVKEVLSDAGYSVIEAENGKQALEIAAAYDDSIHLLITDAIMPEINGRELAAQLMKTRPDLQVLFMSGYASDVIDQKGVLNGEFLFLQKPFKAEILLQSVRDALGKRKA